MSKQTNRQALAEWDEFLLQIRNATPIDTSESEADKRIRIKHLEKPGNQEEWFKYYFPKYSFAEPAAFHKMSSKKVVTSKRIYQSRNWARGLSKSTRRMFEVFYLTLVKKHPTYCLLVSKSVDNAERLLDPYMGNFEGNQRIINDYGSQQRHGKWSQGEFTTRGGATFRAVGMEQNPRGARNEEIRANVLIFDDADDDEVCRNPDRLEKRWDWIERAVIPTVDIAKNYYIFFDNNIIAEDSLALRAQKSSTDVEVINIRDKNGVSTWLEKNSEEDIDDILSKISYEAGQSEYFNNPMSQGKTFKEITWGKCPPIKSLPFVMVYADPSPSNKDKPNAKSKAINSGKCVPILGYKDGTFYLYKCWLDNTSNANFVDWLYQARDYVDGKTMVFTYIENNSLQDPFFEQVLMPLVYQKGADYKSGVLSVMPDARKKPDKWFRIEGTLEPINRTGKLVFNINEQGNPHMERLEAQFKNAKPSSRELDGPDAVEGGVFLIKEKMAVESVGGIQTFGRSTNSRRF